MPYKINPDRNTPWNELPPLPLDKDLFYTIEVLEALNLANRALAKLNGRSVAIPDQGMLVNTISLQEAKTSSQIENIFTTDDELYLAYSDVGKAEHSPAAKEVLYYREALWEGYQFIQEGKPFDREAAVQTFRTIKQTQEGIRPPIARVSIIKAGSAAQGGGQAIYTPPRKKGLLETLLDNLFNYMQNEPLDPLLKMAIGHFQFEAIHPFRDGNGRTGRVLNVNYLVKQHLLDYPILFLSRYILEKKEDYYALLQGVSQRGAWKPWILFMLKAVEETSIHTLQKINAILQLTEDFTEEVANIKGIKNPEAVIQCLFTHPITKTNHVAQQARLTMPTARKYLDLLAEAQLLEKKQHQGHYIYINNELKYILGS